MHFLRRFTARLRFGICRSNTHRHGFTYLLRGTLYPYDLTVCCLPKSCKVMITWLPNLQTGVCSIGGASISLIILNLVSFAPPYRYVRLGSKDAAATLNDYIVEIDR